MRVIGSGYFDDLVARLALRYSRLPVQPLRGLLLRGYRAFRASRRHRTVRATRSGICYELDLNELIDSAIFYHGAFEPKTAAVLDALIPAGSRVYDVGANVGAHTLHMARAVGPAGRVVAFEPTSWARRKLSRNLALNPWATNVLVEKLALGDNPGRALVEFAASWPFETDRPEGRHPIHGGVGLEEEVEFTTLDAYVEREQSDRLDLIKLDVDGYELRVLRGGQRSLARFGPIVVLELGHYSLAEVGDSLAELVQLMQGLGYVFYAEDRLEPFGSVQSVLDAVSDTATINAVASRRPLPEAQ